MLGAWQELFQDIGTFSKNGFGQGCGVREVDNLCIGQIIGKHYVPRFEIPMAVSLGVHVSDGVQDLLEEIVGHIWLKSAKFLEVEVELSSFKALDGHSIVHMKLLAASVDGLGCFDNALGDYLDQFHDIWVPLYGLQSICIIHENGFLIDVCLIPFVEVGTLNNLECLIFHIFLVLKVNYGFINFKKANGLCLLQDLTNLRNNFDFFVLDIFLRAHFLLWLLDIKAR